MKTLASIYKIWYKYKNLAPEIIDTADTMDEAQYLIDEYTIAYAIDISDMSLWIEELKE